MYYVIANYGNESIALIQWLYQNRPDEKFTVLSVDTGWGAESWTARVKQARDWVNQLGLKESHLHSTPSMIDCVQDRKGFPSKKFHWCAGFIKGLAFEQYLDEHDPLCESTIIFAKRYASSRANQARTEYGVSEHLHDRQVWYPLLTLSNEDRDSLIKEAGFDVLSYTSKECLPCIHSQDADIQLLSPNDIKRVEALEKKIGQTMFGLDITERVKQAKGNQEPEHASLESYDMGCGSAFGCGE